jgi:hypothetical protein
MKCAKCGTDLPNDDPARVLILLHAPSAKFYCNECLPEAKKDYRKKYTPKKKNYND